MTTPHELATFFVSGTPKAQPRHQAFAMKMGDGKYRARVFTPDTAEEWKGRVARCSEKWLPPAPIELPVALSLTFFMPRPKALMTARAPDGFVPHVGRPDCDNLAKSVLDAMTQCGWWRDDSQVYQLQVCKRYQDKAGGPGCIVSISTLIESKTNGNGDG